MKEVHVNVGILTFPIHKSGITPLSNLIEILRPLSNQIHLVTGNAGYAFFKGNRKIHSYEVKHKQGTNALSRMAKYILTQLRFLPILIRISRDLDFIIFFLGGETLLLPMLIAKLLRKSVVLIFSASGIAKARKDIFFRTYDYLTEINCVFSDIIILYSKRLIKEYGLEKYKNKIFIASRHFIDFKEFKIEKHLSQRDNIVGYIGRLYAEKGVLEFVRAVPKVLEKRGEVTFLIVGEGQLRNPIEEYIDEKHLNCKIKVSGWIHRKEIPTYLNDLRLLVLPSYTEGLPNIMLEAMACGTPVLATGVGGIPDIIRNGYTGFLMKENSPQCIAENIIRALDHPSLERIANNARVLVEREFAFETAVERYRRVLNLALQR